MTRVARRISAAAPRRTSLATRRTFKALGVLALGLALSACSGSDPQNFLSPAGKPAREIDHLQKPVFGVAIVVFFLVQGIIVFSVIKYRRRPDDDEFPDQVHGNFPLEIGWTILPALLLVGVFAFTLPTIFKVSENPPKGSLTVDVTGQKYWWSFSYPVQTNQGIDKAIITANELHIVAGQPVQLTLRSTDVIHSFWAPKLNGKRDVVPGRIQDWNLEADKPGVYSGQCAEFCGTSHANMRIKVIAQTQADFDAWVAHMEVPPTKPTSGLAAEGFELFSQKGCSGCHRIEGEYEVVSKDSPSAPDLTHLFSRDCFAGCIYDLTNTTELEAWLRDPQRKAGSLMRIGTLTQAEIDRLVAYLKTLE
jgi:cytochrome c oxidase subunit 2